MTSNRFRRLLAASAVGLAAVATGVGSAGLLGACSYPPPETPDPCDKQVVTLNIYAAENINPSEQGRPRPVVVRLYQLATDMRMLNAKYDPILFKDADLLGEDLMQVNEVEVFPNDLVEVKFERIPEATVLAGVALFRDPQGHSWKTYYAFPPMPNTPAACGAQAKEQDPEEPQAAPRTAFFIKGIKIDNGSQFDESMFTQSVPMRQINLPKRSAAGDQPAGADKGAGPSRP